MDDETRRNEWTSRQCVTVVVALQPQHAHAASCLATAVRERGQLNFHSRSRSPRDVPRLAPPGAMHDVGER